MVVSSIKPGYTLLIMCLVKEFNVIQAASTSHYESHSLQNVSDAMHTKDSTESLISSTTDLTSDSGQSANNNSSTLRDERLAYMHTLLEYKIYVFVIEEFNFVSSALAFITNPLTIVVSLKLKPFGTSELYMLVLGATDLIVVITRTTLRLIENSNFVWNNTACKMMFYFTDYSYVFSNWIVVCWSLERLIAVLFPMKLTVWCTVRRVRLVLLSIFIACGCLLVPTITERHSTTFNTISYCGISEMYYTVYNQIITCFYMYIPMIIVFVCNTLIVKKIKEMAKSRTALTTNKETIEKRSRDQRQVTRLLLVVAYTFVFLHIPQVLANIWEAMYPDPIVIYKNSVRDYMRFNLFIAIGYQITDIQNSINFFLYCMFGSKVRKALCDLFGCCRRKQTPSMSSTMVTDMSVSTTAYTNTAFNEQ